MPHREAKKFAIPDGGYARNNYYEGQRTAFNMNYSRGPGAPGTMNYPFRNPAPWEIPKRDWNYQGMQNYYTQQQAPRQPPKPRVFNNNNRSFPPPRNMNARPTNGYQNGNQQGYRSQNQNQENVRPRTSFGPNSGPTGPNMRPNQYNTMQRSPNRQNWNTNGQNNQINMMQEMYNDQDEDDYNDYYVNANHFENAQNQKNWRRERA
jgi:hypothetical protein